MKSLITEEEERGGVKETEEEEEEEETRREGGAGWGGGRERRKRRGERSFCQQEDNYWDESKNLQSYGYLVIAKANFEERKLKEIKDIGNILQKGRYSFIS